MNGITSRTQKKKRMFFAAICLLLSFAFSSPKTVEAGEFDNAYSFYQMYGSDMAFRSGPNMEGEIYYATRAKRSTSGTQYTTVGWKVTVLNSAGAVVDTLYYQLGGSGMVSVDNQIVGGYEYCLYKVTLDHMKSRMNDTAKATLQSANANILFDACTTVKLNGEVQGGMTDSGPSWGEVYTTYEGIGNAKDWSSSAKESLKTYYNKTVKGLFYDVSVSAGEGIQRVTGGGKYCFGTTVTITAEPAEGYHFSHWTGSGESTNQSLSFVLYDGASYTAVGELNSYNIVFDPNGGTGKIDTKKVSYGDVLTLPNTGFELEHSCICGWSTKKGATEAELPYGQEIQVSDLVKKLGLQRTNNGTITLYAVWDHAPEIEGEEIYVSLEDARNGRITEDWLSGYVNASDVEDGIILYGKNEINSFFITNYSSTDFTEFEKEGYVTETFCAVDSSGNITKKIITVHIVDTTVYDAKQFLGEARFISSKYYKDARGNFVEEVLGGLRGNSIWRWNPQYSQLLDKVLMNSE